MNRAFDNEHRSLLVMFHEQRHHITTVGTKTTTNTLSLQQFFDISKYVIIIIFVEGFRVYYFIEETDKETCQCLFMLSG